MKYKNQKSAFYTKQASMQGFVCNFDLRQKIKVMKVPEIRVPRETGTSCFIIKTFTCAPTRESRAWGEAAPETSGLEEITYICCSPTHVGPRLHDEFTLIQTHSLIVRLTWRKNNSKTSRHKKILRGFSRAFNTHHVVISFTDDGGIEAFGWTLQRPGLWLVDRFI